MNKILDQRRTPARGDLAADHLRGSVAADRFVSGVAMRVVAASTPVRRAPGHDAPIDTEALRGEEIFIYDISDEAWAWGQLRSDGYVGWMSADALAPSAAQSLTHRVAAIRTFLYAGPGLKLPVIGALSLGSSVAVREYSGDFSALHDMGWVWTGHLAPIGQFEPDFVAVAERFHYVPYLWGGKTSLGVDCSGLVQIALAAAGISAPRDTDMMERELGRIVRFTEDLTSLRRGDLVFWKGHVGIMRDSETLLHANAHHMMVVSEPLHVARDRTAAKGSGPITSLKRIL